MKNNTVVNSLLPLKATEQQVFDHVVRHLFAQGKRATDKFNINCRLRTDDGLKCAIGCLIPDELYHSSYEENITFLFCRSGPLAYLADKQYGLISVLQCVHDASSSWMSEHHLKTAIIDRLNMAKYNLSKEIKTSILDELHFPMKGG